MQRFCLSQRGTSVKLAGSQSATCNAGVQSAEGDLPGLPAVMNDLFFCDFLQLTLAFADRADRTSTGPAL